MQTYLHGAGVDEMLVKVSSSGPAYYHHDGLGSTIALTGENGELLESYRYDAFGAATILSPSTLDPRPSTAFGNRFLFTGREWLGQAGIYDYRNRVYSASLGRFLQTDPIRFSAGDVNLYRYVGNGPVNGTDPMGLEPGPHIPMSPGQVQLARQAFGPGGTPLAQMNQGLLNQASLNTLGTFQYNAQRGLALAGNSAAAAETQMCRLAAINNAYMNKAGAAGALGATALAAGGTALSIGNAPFATSVGILGVGTVGALGVAAGGVGVGIGLGINQIPTGGSNNVGSSLSNGLYNAAPGFWNWVGGF